MPVVDAHLVEPATRLQDVGHTERDMLGERVLARLAGVLGDSLDREHVDLSVVGAVHPEERHSRDVATPRIDPQTQHFVVEGTVRFDRVRAHANRVMM